MSKKSKLKAIKDIKRRRREYKKWRKNHYKETVEYALDCFVKECYSSN